MLFINKLFNSIACLLSFTNLQLVIPGRTWILLYLGRTVYKHLWACLALYLVSGGMTLFHQASLHFTSLVRRLVVVCMPVLGSDCKIYVIFMLKKCTGERLRTQGKHGNRIWPGFLPTSTGKRNIREVFPVGNLKFYQKVMENN